MNKLTLFPEPKTDQEYWCEVAYQLGVSEGGEAGRAVGIAMAQERMREAQAVVQSAMGICEALGE